MRNRATVKTHLIQLIAITLFFFGLFKGMVNSESAGPVEGRSGVPAGNGFPAEMTCNSSECHGKSEMPMNPDTKGKVEILNLPDNYVPGRRYALSFRITHSDSDRRRWGFQTTAVIADTLLPAGELVLSDTPRRTQKKVGGPSGLRQYIEHNALGTNQGRTGGFTWNFTWVAPSSNVGDVNFYGAGNAADGTSTELNDKIYSPSPNPLAVTKGQYTFTNTAAADHVEAGPGRGVAVGDFDKDGQADLFIAASGQYLLYRNNGGSFTDVARSAGLTAGDAQGQAAAWGDYDGDGDLDLYVVNAGADRLYRNNGDGTFTNVSTQAGISDNAVGHGVAWGDFNGDQQLDLYVANEGQDTLYLNNMNGSFQKVDPMAAGIAEQANGWSVAAADYNADGKLDIFVANEAEDFLYKNNGDGSFAQVATAAGIQAAMSQGRAAAWADFDKDGRPDLFIANVGQDLLFKNNGDGTFKDVTMTAGLVDMAVGAGAAWGDYDKDGDPDLFVTNEGQDFLYRNNGNETFNEVAAFSGMTDMAAGHAAAWADFNKDGNMDLFVSNAAGGNFLYRNPGRSGPAQASIARRTTNHGRDLWISVVTWLVTKLFG